MTASALTRPGERERLAAASSQSETVENGTNDAM